MAPDTLHKDPHPYVAAPPYGALWRRAVRGHRAEGPASHAEAVVLLGRTGSARYLIDGRDWRIGPGTLVWALAGQVHVLLSEDAAFDMWVVLVSGRLLPGGEDGLPPLRIGAGPPPEPRTLSPGAARRLDTLAAEVEASPPSVRGIGLRWWLHRAWDAWQLADGAGGRRTHPAVARAAALLRADPSMSLAAVAAQAGLSAGRLSERFREEVGVSLPDWRTERRLARVEEAVRDGRVTLLDAALDAGFGSYTAFYRAFRARHGRSPRQGWPARAAARRPEHQFSSEP